jgi:sulfur-oxidizing protein SoxY
VLAAEWQKTAFTARNINDALKAYGSANAADSRDIVITAPKSPRTAPRWRLK